MLGKQKYITNKSYVFVILSLALLFCIIFSKFNTVVADSPNGSNATIFSNDILLTQDTVITGDLIVTEGAINLNGYKLTIDGNLIQQNGTININKGELDVKGDYNIQCPNSTYTDSFGILNMVNPEDYVLVEGNFLTESMKNHADYLKAGTLEIKKNFIQKHSEYYGCTNNFATSGTYKVILSGDSLQTVSFDNPGDSYFNKLEITNTSQDGVKFNTTTYVTNELEPSITPITNGENIVLNSESTIGNGGWKTNVSLKGWTLQQDEKIDGNVTIVGDVDLNGHILTIGGNLIQTDGNLNIDKGKLLISGDYNIQSPNSTYTDSFGILNMVNPEDYVLVEGNFLTESMKNHADYLKAGTLEIKKNFIQKHSEYYGCTNNFATSGTYKVVLSGNSLQTVSFDNPGDSYFNNLDLENYSQEGIKFVTQAHFINFIGDGCKVTGVGASCNWNLNKDAQINGDFNFLGGTINLNGYKLTIDGNLIQQNGMININKGELVVKGDYNIQCPNSTYKDSFGTLNMVNPEDYVIVDGNFLTESMNNHADYLKAGTLEIKKNFIQKQSEYYGCISNFATSGLYKVILSGDSLQTVSFDNPADSNFNKLQITNTSQDGVQFNTAAYVTNELDSSITPITNGENIVLNSKSIIGNGSWKTNVSLKGWTLQQDEKIDGNVTIVGDVDLNGHILTIGGNLTQTDGNLNVNKGKMLISGDYNMICPNSTYKDSFGTLNMVNPEDYVLVDGNFLTESMKNHADYLKAGTLEIKKNFIQKQSEYYGCTSNFATSGLYKVILSGDSLQTVSFDNPADSNFNKLEITNTSQDGVQFNTAAYVIDELDSSITPITNGENIVLNSKSIIGNGSWKTNVSLKGWTLQQDEKIDGNVTIVGDVDLNGHILTI